jgi:uncharacterized protein YndB with AHSA1/START domain
VTTSRPTLALALVAALAAAGPAAAEVVDSADHGFITRNAVTVSATAAEVYAALAEVGSWWHPSHTFTTDAANLSLEARPQGCFCEKLPDGGGVRHMTVVAAMPGRLLRLRGGLGPLQGEAVSGTLTWEIGQEGEATTITATYAVHGYVAGGLAGWAGPVDGVIRQQVERLGRWVDTGSPTMAEAAGGSGE